VNRKLLVTRFPLILLASLFIAFGCTKIDTTTIGSGVLPVVDNINTFEEIVDVDVTNYEDTRSDSFLVFPSNLHALGHTNDPVFGKTTANMYFQVTPPQFPFTYPKSKDSLLLDSAVLVVKFAAVYGDSLAKQRINVYPITDDTFKVIHYRPTDTIRKFFRLTEDVAYNSGELLGTAFVSPSEVRPQRKIAYKKDSIVSSELRIRLNDNFGRLFLDQDSNGAFKNESLYRAFFKGFALVPDVSAGGNALMYFLTNGDTKLMIYHQVKKPDGVTTDTTVRAFPFGITPLGSGLNYSANANYIKRERNLGEVAGKLGTNVPSDILYLQSAPGTYARVKMKGVENLSNRIVHRAELLFKQLWTGPQKTEDDLYTATLVYTEIFNVDSGKVIRTVPFDTLIHNPFREDVYTQDYFSYVGGIYNNDVDGSGKLVGKYNINLTRYIQSIITYRKPNYPLQLSIPHLPERFITFQNAQSPLTLAGSGRLKAGGGSHPTYKMKLRIIYSKIR
jgi:Domain of unknown function (DUF4270)